MNKTKQLRDQFRVDPLLMGKVLLPEMFKTKSADFHKVMMDDYMDPTNNKFCYIAPRGHAKSSIAAVMALHHLEFGKHPQKFILIVSKTEGHAIGLLDTIKNIIQGENTHDGSLGFYASFFGIKNRASSRKWGKESIELHDRSIIMAKGTGQQVVGLKKDSQRPTLIIFDDPEDMANTKTAESMDYNLRWMLNGLLPSLDPKGKLVLIGTPQHELCMVETVMKMKGWVCRRWQAIYGEEGWEDDYTKITHVLWPEWQDKMKLIAEYESYLSINKVSSFYREYQCMVIGDGERKFTGNMMRHFQLLEYKKVDSNYHLIKIRTAELDADSKDWVYGKVEWHVVKVQAGIDLASVVSERADFSVLYINGFTADRKVFQLFVDRFKKKPLETAERIATALKKYMPHYVYIEQSGFQVMVRDQIRDYHQVYFPGMNKKIKPHENKEERIYNKIEPFYSPRLNFHQIKDNQILYYFHQKELFMFPRGKTDDSIDAEAISMEKITWPTPEETARYISEYSVNSRKSDYYEPIEDEESWMTV